MAFQLGLLIGILLTTQVLPSLSLNTSGSRITPPFIVRVEPDVLLQYSGLIALILTGQLLVSAALVSRLAASETTRLMGE